MKKKKPITFRCVKCNKKWVGTNKHVCPHCHHFVFGYGHHRW